MEIEQARRFTNRALPMAEAESVVFNDTLALWEQMHLGYQRCLQATIADEAGMRAQGALVCQRALSYTGLKMFHYHRAYRQVPPSVWRELHEGYARAEDLGVAEEPVKDYLNRGAISSPSGDSFDTSTFSAQRSSKKATKVSCRWLSSFGFAMPSSTARRYAMRGEVSFTSRLR